MRSYLPKDLEIEGVDALALLDIVNGLSHIGATLSILPDRVKSGLLMSFDSHLTQSNTKVAPLTKFVLDITAQACKDPQAIERIKAQLVAVKSAKSAAHAAELKDSIAALPDRLQSTSRRPPHSK